MRYPSSCTVSRKFWVSDCQGSSTEKSCAPKNCNCRPEDDQPRVFPEDYHPFGKKGNEIVVGIYGDFIKILSFIQIIVLGGFVWKLFAYAYKDQDACISRGAAVELFIFLALSAYTEWRYREGYRKLKNKYHEREKQYLH